MISWGGLVCQGVDRTFPPWGGAGVVHGGVNVCVCCAEVPCTRDAQPGGAISQDRTGLSFPAKWLRFCASTFCRCVFRAESFLYCPSFFVLSFYVLACHSPRTRAFGSSERKGKLSRRTRALAKPFPTSLCRLGKKPLPHFPIPCRLALLLRQPLVGNSPASSGTRHTTHTHSGGEGDERVGWDCPGPGQVVSERQDRADDAGRAIILAVFFCIVRHCGRDSTEALEVRLTILFSRICLISFCA
jgi:hypothetical protein